MVLRRDLIVILILLVVLPAAIFTILALEKKNSENSVVCIKEICFNVEIADSIKEQQTGLMGRKSMEQNIGMIFIFQNPGIYKFWMKNMSIPLDIIWIDSYKKIIHIEKNVQPCNQEICDNFGPDEKALYVLEINANLSDQYSFEIGDEVKIN